MVVLCTGSARGRVRVRVKARTRVRTRFRFRFKVRVGVGVGVGVSLRVRVRVSSCVAAQSIGQPRRASMRWGDRASVWGECSVLGVGAALVPGGRSQL